jgi:hypothetical protein
MRALVGSLVVLVACGSATIGDPPVGGDPDAHVAAAPDGGGSGIDATVCTAGDHHIVDPQSGHCIAFFENVATWLEARNLCAGLGGTLATISSQQENDLVWPLATNLLSQPDAWLGGTDVLSEGTFTWVNGEPFGFTHFRSGEPNNGGVNATEQEDCLVIEDDTAGTWDDRPCTRAYPYVCEIP